MTFEERLDAMELEIRKPIFRKNRGRANEVNYTPASRTAAREKRIRTLPTAGYIALPNLPPRAALLTAPNLRTAVLTPAAKNPTRRMIPMTMATMPSTMMTTTMRIATTATRTTQQA